MDKLISVIMPTLNVAEYLNEAVDSILNQTYNRLELLVIDDNSSDGTVDILNKYAECDSRVRIIQGSCRGIAAALNMGIDMAEGEYIARMDADDISFLDRLEKQVDFMEKNPEIGVCATQIQLIQEDGEIMDAPVRYPLEDEMIKINLLSGCCVPHPAVMFRGSVIKHGWRYHIMPAEDYELWTRMAVTEKFACLQDTLLYYRVRYTGATKKINAQTLSAMNGQIIKSYITNLFGLDVSGYKPDDVFLFHDKRTFDEPVQIWLFRQYQLLNRIYIRNHEKGIFRNEIMQPFISKSWQRIINNFEFDEKIVGCDCVLDFQTLTGESDSAVRRKLEEIFGRIQELLNLSKKFVIYGLGDYGTKLLNQWRIVKKDGKTGWELVALVDKNKESHDTGEKTYAVSKPDILHALEFDYVLISSKLYYEEIRSEIIKLGIEEDKILYGGRMFNIL